MLALIININKLAYRALVNYDAKALLTESVTLGISVGFKAE